MFGAAAAAPSPPVSLPKGLSPETAEAVQDALRSAGELSAAECADLVGISRVSARRYLEHFVARGAAVVRLQYGGAGRPSAATGRPDRPRSAAPAARPTSGGPAGAHGGVRFPLVQGASG